MILPVHVLLVEDSEDDAFLLTCQLQRHREPIAVTRVDTAFALQAALDSQIWDIVISDYRMPLLSGLGALELVRRHDPGLPFILVSATVGEELAVDAMRAGANDYVMKNKLGRLLPAFQREVAAARARREGADERDAQRQRIERLIHYDPKTGLANATLFDERLALLLKEAGDQRRKLAVVVAQLHRYAAVTEIAGRQGADELIEQAAARLAGLVDDPATIARIGTDRFAIVIADAGGESQAVHAFQRKMKSSFGAPYFLSGCEYRLDPAAGVAIFPDDGTTAESLLRNAEVAAARAGAGGDAYLFYNRRMTENAAEKLAMENGLRRALERDEFVLHYQPKVALGDGKMSAVEALIRWRSPELGLVYPARFITLLEETGLMVEVGAWALRRAAADVERWSLAGHDAPRIAVNVSTSQLRHPDFVALVKEATSRDGAAPRIDLEITESLLMDNVEESIAKLAAIRDLGIGIAIDDFGTGYSSLAYLARLPVSAVKIDRVFVAGMLEDPGTLRLVTTMIELAHSLGLIAIAEGVESQEQAAALHALRCDEIQGYLVGKPVSWEEMRALLEAGGPCLRPLPRLIACAI